MKKLSVYILLLLFVKISFSQTIKEVTSFEVQTILQNLDKKYSVIIDARDSISYSEGHLINAINIDAFKPEAEKKLSQYIDKKHIVVYCTYNSSSQKKYSIS